jgi:hypothetical protein
MLFTKSKLGQAAFKERSALFSLRQRAAYILFDGRATVADVLEKMAPLGVTQQDVDEMCEHGLLEPAPEPLATDNSQRRSLASKFPVQSGWSDADRYLLAKPLATQLTARLGLKGFRLNLAVEAASDCNDLALLLPKIQAAAGVEACRELERVLRG